MGIRFYCPSGHKLNVKTFLAGKRGICPHCGARFRIPKQSMAGEAVPTAMPVTDGEDEATPPRAAAGAPPAALAIAADAPTKIAPGPAITSAATARAPSAPVAAAAAPIARLPTTPQVVAAAAPAPVVGAAAHPTAIARPTSGAPFAVAPAARAPAQVVMPAAAPRDPLAEAPAAIWYVRPPTGGQYGPAPVQVMRDWLGQRRVGPDYLVWREGWPDWRPAAQVFPQLGSAPAAAAPQPAAAIASAASSPLDDDWVDAIIDTRPSIKTHRRHAAPQSNLSLIITLVIILLAIVLAIVLIRIAIVQSRQATSQWNQPLPTASAPHWA